MYIYGGMIATTWVQLIKAILQPVSHQQSRFFQRLKDFSFSLDLLLDSATKSL